jgi:RNA polymerase sigma factor FliA
VPCSVDDLAPTVEVMISKHLGLVGHIARETAARLPRHLDTDDLLGAGALALVQAAHAFDPSLGVPFERFAATRVRGAMLDQMRQRDWATRSVRSRARALDKVSEELTGALQRTPTDTELAAAAGMSVPEVRSIRENTDRAAVLSLDPITQGDASSIGTLQDSSPRPDEVLIAAERAGYLRDAVAELPDRTRVVVSGYYLEHRPLTDIAAELGVTQSRTSQLRAEGLMLLRQALSALLPEGTAGRPDEQEQTSIDGVRARRRNAYVEAVANRSDVRSRADVEAYLRGATLTSGPNDVAESSTSGSGGR